jgi:hypothetical protein
MSIGFVTIYLRSPYRTDADNRRLKRLYYISVIRLTMKNLLGQLGAYNCGDGEEDLRTAAVKLGDGSKIP